MNGPVFPTAIRHNDDKALSASEREEANERFRSFREINRLTAGRIGEAR